MATDLKVYMSVIKKCALFCGMDEKSVENSLKVLKAEYKSYKKGEFLHFAGESFKKFGLVLFGTAAVMADDIEGNCMIMASVTKGNTFGEALCFLNIQNTDVYAIASEDCEILWLSPDELFCGESKNTELQKRFTKMVARRTLDMNDRIQILSKLTIREKIIAYLTVAARQSKSESIEIPLNREAMAGYIGTNRSALSRELSNMKKDGLIEIDKNSYKILKNK